MSMHTPWLALALPRLAAPPPLHLCCGAPAARRCAGPRAQARGDDLDDAEFLDNLDRQVRGISGGPSFVPLAHVRARLVQLDLAARGRGLRRRTLFERRAAPPRRRTREAIDPLGELTREDTQLFRLPATIGRLYDDFLNRPGQKLILGALSLLLGFYLAGSLSTIFGAAAFWEPVSALIPALVTERISREYFRRGADERSTTLELLNALKCGFYFGVILDALKLAG